MTGQAPGRRGQRPPEHRPVRDLRHQPTASSPWPSGPSGSGRGSAPRSALPALAVDPRFATNGDRVEHRARAAAAPRRAPGWRDPRRDWSAALDAADVPCGPITDIAHGLRVAGGARAGRCSVEVEHPAFGVLRQAGIPIQLRRHAGRDPDAPRRPRRAHRRDPRRAGLRCRTRDRSRLRASRGRSEALCRPACDRRSARVPDRC